ncbi:HPr family phosphocarrier protein [Eubacterium aggregans]|uniref:HPr family phosphocarrier protein n=1 Tax=Eubacterium aggregans TaxID=81409 RepID=UPI0023F1D070|nr:HPr family phosphocarrier protein [Eubacterium aggregans]MDD4692769.1 HPr family phosphocarrier protein [Eubacterium aggregans]
MYVKEVKVVNPTGLHARPAAEFTKVAGQYQADLTIVRLTDQPKEGNAKSVISVMSMGLTAGTTLRITGNGPDEVEAVDALVALVDGGFGEV